MLKLLTKETKSSKSSLQPKNDARHHLLDSNSTRIDFTDVKLGFAQTICVQTSMKKKGRKAEFCTYTQTRPNGQVQQLQSISDDNETYTYDINARRGKPRITKFT